MDATYIDKHLYIYENINDSEECEEYKDAEIVTIAEGVTSIADFAFSLWKSLKKVTLPNSLTHIGMNAFSFCDSLQFNKYDNGFYLGNDSNPYHAFIETIQLSCCINDNTKVIADYAFDDCESLRNITIPASVVSIGVGNSLAEILVDENNPYYKSIDGNLYSKDGKTLIRYAVSKQVSSFVIPDGVTSIGDSAFRDCYSLTNIAIPDSVISIGDSAFNGCDSLTSIAIPGSVISIGDSAFNACESLTSITIPDSVESIGCWAFDSCTSLTSIEIPDSVMSIGDHAFSNCSSLTSATLGYCLTNIGEGTFSYCEALESIIIPASVTSIGENAFRGCDSLTIAIIPDSVTSIADYAFASCTSLASVKIPDSVESIGVGAFFDTPYERKEQGVCQHCGGYFVKGIFSSKCASCGRKKDY